MPQQKKKAAKRPRRAARSQDVRVLPAVTKSTLLAFGITLAVGLLLLVITTAILLATKDPDRYHAFAGPALLYLTALIGGALAVKLYGRRAPVLCGLSMGICLFLFSTAVALFLPNAGANKALALLLRMLILPAAVLGSSLSSRQKKPRRR